MEKITQVTRMKRKIWSLGPSSVASLMCLPFGIMLGWPSPTYPKLLPSFSPNTPIDITLDQSAMIAGFLMIGNVIGTPFSTKSMCGAKYGLLLGLLLMIMGWIVMRFATSIYFLLGSRLLVGLGCGYGVGQLKIYITNMSEPPWSRILTRLITFYTFLGVTTAFTLGYLTTFTTFSTVAIVITSVIIVLCLFLPHSPQEYLQAGKEHEARVVLLQIKSNFNVDNELHQLKLSAEKPMVTMSFIQVCKDRFMKKYVAIICLLTFFQQFTGAPATIIYTQIIFTESHCAYPEIIAIAYSVLFFISNFLGTFFMDSFNKKSCLLFSSVSVTLSLALNITVFYFNLNDTYWRYTSLVTMFLYVFVHSTGLGVVPFMLTQDYFSSEAVGVISKFQIMQHSFLALVITKIFQVLYGNYNLYVPFCLFFIVAILSSLFVWFVVPYESVLIKSIKSIERSDQLLTKL